MGMTAGQEAGFMYVILPLIIMNIIIWSLYLRLKK